MRIREFFCFFNDLGDFLDALLTDIFNINCTIRDFFIIREPIYCGSRKIELGDNRVYFSFTLWVSISFLVNNPPERIEGLASNLKEHKFFTDKSKRNFICSREDLAAQLDEDYKLKKAYYFDGFIPLVKYCNGHGLINLKALDHRVREEVIGILNL